MNAILKTKPEPGAEIREVDVPTIGPEDVLVKILATSICGTDVHIYTWDPWSQGRIKPPRIFGHEFSGEVVEVGERVRSVKVGDYVSAETHIACGHCYMCRTGKKHICLNVEILGVDVDGCFAEYISVPEENVWKTDRSIPPEIACLQEPFGNAVHSVLVEDVAGRTVSVFGCGPIGLMSIAVARASGASKVFAVETDDYRLRLAEPMGATRSVNPLKEEAAQVILDETGGLGVDVFLEMSGAEAAIVQGLRSLRKGGRVSLLGITPGDIKIDLNDGVVFKQATLYGINGRLMFDTWYRVSELLSSGRIDLSPLVTHRMKLEEIHRGMDLLVEKKACKVVLDPQRD
jgi:threonine 3-dehydrogenase